MDRIPYVKLLIVCCVAVAACGLNIFPVSKDTELGKQVDGQIRSNPKQYPIMKGHDDVRTYVRGVAQQVLTSPDVKYRGTFPYTVEIIQDDKTVNAFCTPGGYIYVYTGLLKFVENEATLAGVLAHEVAHAERRHSTQRMTKQLGVQEALNIALGKSPGKIESIVSNLGANAWLLQNSRGDEAEADEYSFKYLRATKYYPGAIKFFFEKMLRTNKDPGGVQATLATFLSDHPLSESRLDDIEKLCSDNHVAPPVEASLRTIPYRSLVSKLP
jgi:predicted Zn-dependent protease